MIEARGLVKRYGSTMAVSDLSFSIRPGMVTGLLGPNGAGKTTTIGWRRCSAASVSRVWPGAGRRASRRA